MSTESFQDTLLNLEQIKAKFPPQKKPFPASVKDGSIIEAIVSINNEGVIIYVEPESAKLVPNPETGGV